MKRALRGINLGGWLVAERWMTPQLFVGVSGAGERSMGRELGLQEASRRLNHHRSTFITDDDFARCRAAGFDFVRIPVGYWLFEEAEGFVSGEQYLRRAFDWANHHELQIVIDLHGLQGSQNGYDHSGQMKQRFFKGGHIERALGTVEYLARVYGKEPALLGLQLINEPRQGLSLRRLLEYYERAIAASLPHLGPGVKIIVSDAFWPVRMARMLHKKGYGNRVVMDVHLYQTELGWWQRPQRFSGYISRVTTKWSKLLDRLDNYLPIMVGEWSAAVPTAALGSDSSRQYAEYFMAQQKLFDTHSWAHCYWTYKAPHNGPWDYMTQNFGGLVDED